MLYWVSCAEQARCVHVVYIPEAVNNYVYLLGVRIRCGENKSNHALFYKVYRALSIIYGSYEYGTEKGQDDPAGTQWYHCFKHILIANF